MKHLRHHRNHKCLIDVLNSFGAENNLRLKEEYLFDAYVTMFICKVK